MCLETLKGLDLDSARKYFLSTARLLNQLRHFTAVSPSQFAIRRGLNLLQYNLTYNAYFSIDKKYNVASREVYVSVAGRFAKLDKAGGGA